MWKRKRKKFFSLIFVPDEDKDPRSISMSYTAGFFVLLGLAVLGIHVIAGAIGYFRVIQLESARQKLLRENQELQARNQRIDQIVREFLDIKKTDEKIRKAFGATLGIKETPGASSALSPKVSPESSTSISDTMKAKPSYFYFLSTAQEDFFRPECLPTLLPVEGVLTSHFGKKGVTEKAHWGIDIAAQKGTPVLAAGAGVVILADWTPDLGYLVILSHGMGFYSYYGHCQRILVEQGMEVKKGQLIAFVGSSGISSAPHLHFEIWKDNQPIDPETFVYISRHIRPGDLHSYSNESK